MVLLLGLSTALGAFEAYREHQRNADYDATILPAAQDFLEVVGQMNDVREALKSTTAEEKSARLGKFDELVIEASGLLGEVRDDLREVCGEYGPWYLFDYPGCRYLDEYEELQPLFQAIENVNVRIASTAKGTADHSALMQERDEKYRALDPILDRL